MLINFIVCKKHFINPYWLHHLGLINHREMQLRSELSEAITRGDENVQTTSDGRYNNQTL